MARAQRVETPFAWDDDYRYSQVMRLGELVFVSGQAAIGERGEVVGEGDFEAQARQVFANLRACLESAGSSLEEVVKVGIFLTDMANFGHIVECRERYFSPPYPADTTVQVGALALPGLMLEIEAIATTGG